MMELITGLPTNMIGFRATGEVTRDDFERIVNPYVKRVVEVTGELNYLLVLDTSIRNFSVGAWFQDAFLGLKHIMKWKRAAIVSDSIGIKKFTDVFSILIPGEFKGFYHKDLAEAINWVSQKQGTHV